jgi:hypothetical protein
VSLFADIIQSLGPGSVPFVVAGTVFGVFELGERLASQRAKDALSRWLVSFDVQNAKALPEGTQELFERLFGERHFSWKCFVRSAMFSVGAMAFAGLLCLLVSPESFGREFGSVVLFGGFFLTLWLSLSIFIDYLSLFKTRIILRSITQIPGANSVIAIGFMLIIDYLVYRVLFSIGFSAVAQIQMDFNFIVRGWKYTTILQDLRQMFEGAIDLQAMLPLFPSMGTGWFIWYWSGFAPSIWMWLYVLALFVTRTLLRSEKLVNWLRWFLDVEKNPFRSIGAVAAALTFIASLAIILVSAEISRISGVAKPESQIAMAHSLEI